MLQNVEIRDKGSKPNYMDKDMFDKSSDIKAFNLFQQDEQMLREEGLLEYFERIQQRQQQGEGSEYENNEPTQTRS